MALLPPTIAVQLMDPTDVSEDDGSVVITPLIVTLI